MSEKRSSDFIECGWFETNIYALLDSEVTDAEKSSALRHMTQCSVCNALYLDAARMQQELLKASCVVPPSEDAWGRFQARLLREESLDLDVVIPAEARLNRSSGGVTHLHRNWGAYSLAAAAGVLFVLSTDSNKIQEEEVGPVVEVAQTSVPRPVDAIQVIPTASEPYEFRQNVRTSIEVAELASMDVSGVAQDRQRIAESVLVSGLPKDIPQLSDILVDDAALHAMLEISISETEKFLMDRFPVTNREYFAFVAKTGHRKPFHWSGTDYKAVDSDGLLPVTYVSWDDAMAFCRWEGKDLPSAKQFEAAGTGLGSLSASQANVKESGLGLVPVGSFASNVSWHGVHELVGNVRQWVKDSASMAGFVGANNSMRMQKGASFLDQVSMASIGSAFVADQEAIPGNTGFRCVK